MDRLWTRYVCLVCILVWTSKCSALVGISTPVSEYWGSDGDAELQISANVTSDDGWEAVAVTVSTPDGRNMPAVTEDDNDNATSKIYTHTINSLFYADGGMYNFTVQDGDGAGSGGSEASSVTVYIYTIAIFPTSANYYVVERTEELSISVDVKTDADWANVEVNVETPSGDTLPTTDDALEVAFWRRFSATIEDIVEGTYTFVATETLGGKAKTVSSPAIVEVSETTNVDEYLFRIAKLSSSITSHVPDFYNYVYDGPDNTYITDGGQDMYDRGNYVSISEDNNTTPNIPYGKPYTFENYVFSSVTTYPFTTLIWISNENAASTNFSLQVTGQTGATGGVTTAQLKSQFTMSSYSVTYEVAQVFGDATDPSICEVYFYIANEEEWSSVEPTSVDFNVNGILPKGLDNTYTVRGAPKNIMMGYMLLSREGGRQVDESDIVSVLEEVASVIEVTDSFTMTSTEDDVTVERTETTATLTTRVTTSSDWSNITVTIMIPAGTVETLTEFDEDGDARLYKYSISDLSEQDSGVYTFTATDNYFGFTQESTTTLFVLLAEVYAQTSEYWGVDGDEELILSVVASANDWTDTKVMVTRPDGEVHEATTEETGNGTRTYIHRVTNLFIEDAGEYIFTTETNGITTSKPANIVVYLFTVAISPESFHSHAIEKEDKAIFMVYVVCDGIWANVQGVVTSPNGNKYPMLSTDGSIPTVRIFNVNITDAVGGEYDITITETQGSRSESRSIMHTIEIHNATHVDEYLYRIGLVSDELVSYVDRWQNYWYDGPDHSFITDGGFDMYDRGNYISLYWSSEEGDVGEEMNIPYGKPVENDILTYSSKDFYPFVSLLWIDNQNRSMDEFSITVNGRTGMPSSAKYETINRVLFEGTYDVTYYTFQAFDSVDPSICEVYFLITNTYEWNSVLPDTFDISVGGTPPQILQNTAKVTGSPSNIMLGYTLLSKDDGNQVDYFEIEKVVEKYVDVIAERDQFGIMPSTEDGLYIVVEGENATVEAIVTTSGKWDGITVEVILPSGMRKTVTDYTLTNLHTQRIFQYAIPDSQYSDRGDYTFIVTDKYGEREETVSRLDFFTLKSYATTTQYVGGQDDTIVMEFFVTSETMLVVAEIDTPTLGTLNVTDWTDDWTDVRTYRHTIENPTYEVDNGNYTFRITEILYNKYEYPTAVGVDLAVFSVSTSVADQTIIANAGDEILRIPIEVSTFGDWDAIEVKGTTPRRGIPVVTEFDTISDTKRNYIYEMRNVAAGDAGNYFFVATETLYGESESSEADTIFVEIKEEKLSGGAIAGIVIGSVAGVLLIGGIAWYCMRDHSSSTKSAKSAVTYSEKEGIDLAEKPEKDEVDPKHTAL